MQAACIGRDAACRTSCVMHDWRAARGVKFSRRAHGDRGERNARGPRVSSCAVVPVGLQVYNDTVLFATQLGRRVGWLRTSWRPSGVPPAASSARGKPGFMGPLARPQ
jgi:hypothetical protein